MTRVQLDIQTSDIAATQKPFRLASTLPARYYRDPAVYERELERIFYRSWLMVGRVDRLPEPGDFFTHRIGPEEVVILRDKSGMLRGFYNVCRHRGSRIITSAEGHGLRDLECPYHSWIYGLDGKLIGAPYMEEIEGFDKADYSLAAIRVETWGSFIFINLDPKAQPLDACLGDLPARLKRFHLEELRTVHRTVGDVACNWKLSCENYLECYHCPTAHPEFCQVLKTTGGSEPAGGPYIGGWNDFREGCSSTTLTGRSSRPPMGQQTSEDLKRSYGYLIYPNLTTLFSPDHMHVDMIMPNGPERTRIISEWYFPETTIARKDFDPKDAIDFWSLIHRQDWRLCELAQEGMASRSYNRSRYSGVEQDVHEFDNYILSALA